MHEVIFYILSFVFVLVFFFCGLVVACYSKRLKKQNKIMEIIKYTPL